MLVFCLFRHLSTADCIGSDLADCHFKTNTQIEALIEYFFLPEFVVCYIKQIEQFTFMNELASDCWTNGSTQPLVI